MRYLLHESQRDELAARRIYLYEIFHMYFIPEALEGSYIPLRPLGPSRMDILFITGHTNHVRKYLETTIDHIPEGIIVITSCIGSSFRHFAAKKDIYVPNLQKPLCHVRDGRPYGFEFPISDAELDLYNATGEIMERIAKAYDRLTYKERK